MTPLDTDLSGWLKTFAKFYFKGLSNKKTKDIMSQIIDICRPKLFHDQKWYADYVRLRLCAIRK